ncbi:hypothetical protein HPB50_013551 [Hyalomma asiaticum]|uniref:Uncharacterized protein n=1 Tax=Hyalomma asiaticum TaxID=266040 RepID=A0ACB7SQ99_HYAAI|nr:hypothetical protein HPB50_013551 [Hyalomma asiaticum]
MVGRGAPAPSHSGTRTAGLSARWLGLAWCTDQPASAALVKTVLGVGSAHYVSSEVPSRVDCASLARGMEKRGTDSHCFAPGCCTGYPNGPKASLGAEKPPQEVEAQPSQER